MTSTSCYRDWPGICVLMSLDMMDELKLMLLLSSDLLQVVRVNLDHIDIVAHPDRKSPSYIAPSLDFSIEPIKAIRDRVLLIEYHC